MRRLFFLPLLTLFALAICAAKPGLQETSRAQPAGSHAVKQFQGVPASMPIPREEDVSSPSAILAAVYGVISGPAGQKRDWDRFRSLFAPGARLIPTVPTKGGSLPPFRQHSMTPEEYVSRADSYFGQNGFYEREIARKTEHWGNILQAFSTYESRHHASDASPFERGINSFQLFFDGRRWWIVTIMWQGETPANQLTPEFLPRGK